MRASRWSRSQARSVLCLAVVVGATTALPATGLGQGGPSPSIPVSSPVASSPAPRASTAPDALSSDPGTFAWYDLRTAGGEEQLHLGGFDGRSEVVATSDDPILASGPAAGRVIAATTRGTGSDVWLIDTASGDVQRLRRDPQRITSLALDPTGGTWWWVTTGADGRSTLRRQPVAGGPATAVAGPRHATLSILTPGLDRVAWWGLDRRGRPFATIVRTDGTAVPVDGVVGDVVGFLGDELVSYAGTGSELGYPLAAFDPATGMTREIVSGGASFAMIGTDATGAPALIVRVLDETNAWRYAVIGVDGRTTLLDSAVPDDLSMERSTQGQGSSTPGFLPLTPTGGFAGIDMAADWVLLPLDGGPAIGPGLPAAAPEP